VAEFVSRVLKPGIRRILAEADFLLFAEGFDLRAGDTQKRAVNGEFAELGNRSHATESSGTCSSEEVEKTGLDLIIGMVGQDEGFCFFPGDAFLKEGHAQFAGGEFEGFFLGCGKLRSPRAGMLDGKIQTARLADNKAGVRI
jgi:hypothetical protein